VELGAGALLSVAWEDEDVDDNATITFALESSEATEANIGPFVIGPPLAEDPDGASGDSAALALTDVLPGLFDLVGRISDGELEGIARVQGVVRILPEPENDPPVLVLTQPAAGVEVEIGPGDSFLVAWEDSDADHNARISILLDPDETGADLDGDEILLAASLGEDEDGVADSILLGVPTGVAKGDYRVVGVITDGIVEVVTRAPGIVRYGSTDGTEPGTGDPDPPELTVLEPSEALRVRYGDDIGLFLETANIPEGAAVNLYLTNAHVGGAVRADVTPASIGQNVSTAVTVPSLAAGVIPNDAWPREFRLEAELEVSGEVEITEFAPASIWIRQEVMIQEVLTVNYACAGNDPVDVDDREFIGLEIAWYGGGFEEREAHAPVQLWLSNDAFVPVDGLDDDHHRLFETVIESPNVPRVVRVAHWQVMGLMDEGGEELIPALEPGAYQLITVTESEEFGRIISEPHPDWFDVCLRIRDPGTGRMP